MVSTQRAAIIADININNELMSTYESRYLKRNLANQVHSKNGSVESRSPNNLILNQIYFTVRDKSGIHICTSSSSKNESVGLPYLINAEAHLILLAALENARCLVLHQTQKLCFRKSTTMPKGMEVRRAQLLEMHATMVDIPEGADILEHLNKAADEAGYIPFVVLSAIGKISSATLRIPNEDALGEVKDIESFFNVKVVKDLKTNPKYKEMPIAEFSEEQTLEDLPADFPHPSVREKKPHWSSIQNFDDPLTLLYAVGGRRRPTSSFKYHFILSGSPSRSGGVSDSFVGELLPGCIAGSPLQFVVGLSAPRSTTVQAWTVSVQPGYDVVEQLKVFIRARQTLGKCFFFSASGGMLLNATVKNVSNNTGEHTRTLEADEGPYLVENMTAIINAKVEDLRIHATIILNCSSPPCDAIGGELVKAIVGESQSLDFCLGEMIEEQYFPT